MSKMTREGLRFFGSSLLRIEFLVLSGILFALSVAAYVPREGVENWGSGAGMVKTIFWAEGLGFLFPGPRYIVYPLIAVLMEGGLAAPAIIAVLTAQAIMRPDMAVIEFGLFGYRFIAKRVLSSIILATLAGIAAALLSAGLGVSLL
jgi:uncharacterized membrane protein YraQ (UPF0718 family)